MYILRIPSVIQNLFSSRIWRINTQEKVLFLTFDDGPHPQATTFVLDQLRQFNAKATFFCIGKNVKSFPDIYSRILAEGHKTGNHTYDHLNGWKAKDREYLANIAEAKIYIDSELFRPPYGRITNFQVRQLKLPAYGLKTVMWTILSGDFDPGITKEKCLANVALKAKAGDIIVFHDSEKCFEKLQFALPRVLTYFTEKGYRFESLAQVKKNGPG